MPLLVFDAALGAILIVAVILLGSRQQKRKPGHLRVLGWALVSIPLPVAVLLHVLRAVQQATDQTLFIAGVVSFAFGAALLLGSKDDEDEDWRHSSDDSPPWWPEFEREFRAYSRVRPHDRSLTRV